MSLNKNWSRTDFDRPEIKLPVHFDRGLIGRYFDPVLEWWIIKRGLDRGLGPNRENTIATSIASQKYSGCK